MKNWKLSKALKIEIDIHNADETGIKEFLNCFSKEIGAIKYLGSYSEDIELMRDFGIRANLKNLFVERNEFENKSNGNEYEYHEGTRRHL